MKKIIRNVQKEEDEKEKERLIEEVKRRVLKVTLNRLTPEEIEQYSNVKKPNHNKKVKPTPLTPTLLSVVLKEKKKKMNSKSTLPKLSVVLRTRRH